MTCMQARVEGGGTAPTNSQVRRQKWVGRQHHVPAALLPRKTRYPLYKTLRGPWAGLDGTENLAPPDFYGQTVQRVAIAMEALPRNFPRKQNQNKPQQCQRPK